MSDKPRLLCVDDEPELLASLKLNLRRSYNVTVAESGPAALALFDGAPPSRAPFDVVISDMRMPQMSGAQLLSELRRRFPDVPRLLLSGQADLDSTISAINNAKVFRFLTKPVATEHLIEAVDDALEQARLARVERELLDRTLKGTVGLLTEVLGLVSVGAYSRSQRIETFVTDLSGALGRPVPWDLALAAKLSQLGFVVLDESVDDASHPDHPQVAADLLVNIPRMEPVAYIISHQLDEAPVGKGPDILQWTRREANAEILRMAVRFDTLTANGMAAKDAHRVISAMSAPPPKLVLEALATLRLDGQALMEAKVNADHLADGMHLANDVMAANGLKLASAGTVLTSALIGRIRTFAGRIGVSEPISVLVPEAKLRRLQDVLVTT